MDTPRTWTKLVFGQNISYSRRTQEPNSWKVGTGPPHYITRALSKVGTWQKPWYVSTERVVQITVYEWRREWEEEVCCHNLPSPRKWIKKKRKQPPNVSRDNHTHFQLRPITKKVPLQWWVNDVLQEPLNEVWERKTSERGNCLILVSFVSTFRVVG